LQTRRRFAVAAFAPGLLNVAMIAAAIVLPAILLARGIDPIFALAVGALVGGALQVAAQIPALRSAGFTGFVAPTFDDPKVREVVRRIAPMTFGLMIYELDLILSRRFLSSAGEGANSYFYYAQRLCDFPQGIFSLALATATLPSLSKLVARGDRRAVASTFAHALNLALFVALPATALLVGLARPIVVAMFGRGEFDATSVDGTSTALIAQGFGVWTVAVVRQVVPLFYALGDTKTPVIVSGLDLVAFIAIAVGLTPTLGHVGVSLAVTGSSLVQAALLVFALRKRLPELRGRDVLPSAVRTTIASVAAVVVAVIVARALAAFGVRGVRSMLALAIEGATFAIAFVVTARLVGSAELDALATAALRRLRRRSPPAVS
jgi:putative peptidoglycan lipid II flippase